MLKCIGASISHFQMLYAVRPRFKAERVARGAVTAHGQTSTAGRSANANFGSALHVGRQCGGYLLLSCKWRPKAAFSVRRNGTSDHYGRSSLWRSNRSTQGSAVTRQGYPPTARRPDRPLATATNQAAMRRLPASSPCRGGQRPLPPSGYSRTRPKAATWTSLTPPFRHTALSQL